MRYILLVFTVVLLLQNAYATDTLEVSVLKKLVRNNTSQPTYSNINKRSVAGVFFFAYKKYVSSQDFFHCGFSPSCSQYGALAVRKKGLLKGILLTFDRLTRCNGRHQELYEVDPDNGLLLDPID